MRCRPPRATTRENARQTGPGRTGQAGAERFDEATGGIDRQRAGPHQRGTRSEDGQISLLFRGAVRDGVQNTRIHARLAGEFLGIVAIALLITWGEGGQVARVRHNDPVPESGQQLADPERVSARLEGDAYLADRCKTSRQRGRRHFHPSLVDDLPLGSSQQSWPHWSPRSSPTVRLVRLAFSAVRRQAAFVCGIE